MNSAPNPLSAEYGSVMPNTAELGRVRRVIERVQQMGRIATAAVAITVGTTMPADTKAAEPGRAAHQVNSGANTSRITSIYSYIEQKNFSYNASALVKEFTLFTYATQFIEEYKPTLNKNMNDPTVHDAVAVMFGDYYNWLVQKYNQEYRNNPGDEKLTLHSTLFESLGLPEHHGQPLNTSSKTPVHHYAVVSRLDEPVKVSWTTVGSTVTAAQATHEIEEEKPSTLTATKAADTKINSAMVNQRIHEYIAEKQFKYDAYALLKTVNTYIDFDDFLRGNAAHKGYEATLLRNMNDDLITDAFAVMVGDYYKWVLEVVNAERAKIRKAPITFDSDLCEHAGIPKPLVIEEESESFGKETISSIAIGENDDYLVVWGSASDGEVINGEVFTESQIPGNQDSKTFSYSVDGNYQKTAWRKKLGPQEYYAAVNK